MKTIVSGLLAVLFLTGCAEQDRSVAVQPKLATPSQAKVTPSGEPTYPKELSPEQRQLLVKLGDLHWFTRTASVKHEEKKKREYSALVSKTEDAGLPKLATPSDITVSESEIKNKSDHDVLIVLQHETGHDVAIRTHWLRAGQSVPNRSAFSGWGKVWIVAPRIETHTEPEN